MHWFADQLGLIASFAGVVVAAASAYKFLFQKSVARHHAVLIGAIDWASQGKWSDALRSIFGMLLSIMSVIYGPPSPNASGIRRYLTDRAWKISVWIASIIISSVAPGLLLIAMALSKNFGPDANVVLIIVTTLLVAAVMIAFHVAMLRGMLAAKAPGTIKEAVWTVLRGASLAITTIGAPIIFLLGVVAAFQGKPPDVLGYTVVMLLIVTLIGGFVWSALRTIKCFNVFAPLVWIAGVAIALYLSIHILFFWFIWLSVAVQEISAGTFPLNKHFPLLGLILLTLNGATAMGVIAAAVGNTRRRRLVAGALAVTVLTTAVEAFCIDKALGSAILQPFFSGALREAIATFAPMILVYCGLLFASSIPDWLCVATTRMAIERAIQTRSLLTLATWVLACVGAALAGMTLTVLILAITNSLQLGAVYLAQLVSHQPLANAPQRVSELRGGLALLNFLPDLVIHGWSIAWRHLEEVARAGGSRKQGFIGMVLSSMVGLPTILPLTIGIAVTVASILSRALLIVFGAPMRTLHSFLVLPEGASVEEAAVSYGRAAGLFGFVGAALISVALLLVHFVLAK